MKQHLLPKAQVADKLLWERRLWDRQIQWIAGLDEAGRGAWAGPVVAAAVVFKPHTFLPDIDDSKKLSPLERERLFDVICEQAHAFSIAYVSSTVIDSINILKASLQAMTEAVHTLSQKADYLLIDGRDPLEVDIPQSALIKGDSLSQSIGAASILAKVSRDRLMKKMEGVFPDFSFSKHKGYGTKAHQEEIQRYGLMPEHRRSFKPIQLIAQKAV